MYEEKNNMIFYIYTRPSSFQDLGKRNSISITFQLLSSIEVGILNSPSRMIPNILHQSFLGQTYSKIKRERGAGRIIAVLLILLKSNSPPILYKISYIVRSHIQFFLESFLETYPNPFSHFTWVLSSSPYFPLMTCFHKSSIFTTKR